MTDFTVLNKGKNIIQKINKSIDEFRKKRKLCFEDLEEEEEDVVEDSINISVNHRNRLILL